ncbi:Alpha/Beta hydrolase protein [Podospora australis]|uniref:Alpha/Beta hydrolase protein n=1 Tax=Podospora australis TaxID=1536484 RepID=A0AAN6WSS4_9PEZI|nr:Alpha/Beta hydrolase protein [Podospora australis]
MAELPGKNNQFLKHNPSGSFGLCSRIPLHKTKILPASHKSPRIFPTASRSTTYIPTAVPHQPHQPQTTTSKKSKITCNPFTPGIWSNRNANFPNPSKHKPENHRKDDNPHPPHQPLHPPLHPRPPLCAPVRTHPPRLPPDYLLILPTSTTTPHHPHPPNPHRGPPHSRNPLLPHPLSPPQAAPHPNPRATPNSTPHATRTENVGGAKAAAAARSLRLTVDPVRICYRSVLWYGIVTLTDCITHFHLWRAGFVHHRPSSAKPPATPNRSSPQLNGEQPVSSAATATTKKTPLSSLFHSFPPRLAHTHHMRTKSPSGEIGYYYRPHKSLSKLPVVFIHGIGIGLWPYREFLSELLNEQEDGEQVGILALEILPFSTRLTSPPLSRARSLEEIQGILAQQGPDWKEFVLVTHSYGSVLATHILHSPELKPRVKGLVMVDPVTVLLHLPDVAYNFTRRPPRRANEWQLWYFASMDVGVAEGLGRHFFWRENIIWREELQQIGTDTQGNVAICLSGRDLIVDTHTVARYLASEGDLGSDETNNGLVNVAKYAPARGGNHLAPSGLEILWYPDLDHAQIFESQRDRRHVIEVVSRYCQRSRSRNVDL